MRGLQDCSVMYLVPVEERICSKQTSASMLEITQMFERISADFAEMVTSARGYRYVLVDIDNFFCYLQFTINKDAGSVADAYIDELFTLFGPPWTLLMDNGSEFLNQLFRQVY